jgi:hypothetical protein
MLYHGHYLGSSASAEQAPVRVRMQIRFNPSAI